MGCQERATHDGITGSGNITRYEKKVENYLGLVQRYHTVSLSIER